MYTYISSVLVLDAYVFSVYICISCFEFTRRDVLTHKGLARLIGDQDVARFRASGLRVKGFGITCCDVLMHKGLGRLIGKKHVAWQRQVLQLQERHGHLGVDQHLVQRFGFRAHGLWFMVDGLWFMVYG